MTILKSLQSTVQAVSSAPDLQGALRIIVQQVRQIMAVDVCYFCVTDHQTRRHVLMATEGLRQDAVGRAYVAFDEGLVGLVAERAEPVNVGRADQHPRFKFIPESGEKPFKAFLEVPVIHQREVLGVLVVQQRTARRFRESHVALLITLAAQLAGAIALAKINGEFSRFGSETSSAEWHFEGDGAAPGLAMGIAVPLYPSSDLQAIPDRKPQDLKQEETKFLSAVAQTCYELRHLDADLITLLSPEERALFDAYAMILEGSLADDVIERIRAGNWAPGALRDTIHEHARRFEAMDDAYLRERSNDIRDLGRRVLSHLQDNKGSSCPDYPERTILVGEQVSAIDLANVSPGRLAGIVSARGSALSHVAILARALGIPTVMGVANLPVARLEAQELLVDGYRGWVCVRPGPSIRSEFTRLLREEQELAEELQSLRQLPSETPDGVSVSLYTNIGLTPDINHSLNIAADGVGLYRTEFAFMARDRFPSEEEQRTLYRYVLEAFAPKPVYLRTLDVGGDKPLPYLPVEEDNPFLGWRGIRLMLDHPEIFLSQVRAALRASAGLGNLNLLFPMISSLSELEDALGLTAQAYQELKEEGADILKPRLGVMIEVPSAVYQAESLARRVDFLSLGTNDLMQYLLAADRNNQRVASLLDPLHPAVLQAVISVIETAHRVGKSVSVCGEAASDPAFALLLLGMGVDSFSVSAGNLLRIKWVIRNFTHDQARKLLNLAVSQEKPEPIRELLNSALEDAGLGGIIRAGKSSPPASALSGR